MRCEVCGLDNDPSLDYCDNCEHPLRDSTTEVLSARPVARPSAPRPIPVAASDYDDEAPVQGGFQDRLAEPRPLARPLLVGAAVLALAGAIGGVILAARDGDEQAAPPGPEPTVTTQLTSEYTSPPTTGSTSVAPTADPAAQALALDRLLDRSKQSRDKLTSANDAVFRCSGLSGAIARLREVGTERDAEREDLSGLDLSAIANGEAIRQALDTALAHSLTADGYYVKWAQEKQRNGCRETSAATNSRTRGDDESAVAGTAKIQFLKLWNPVAGELALPVRDRQGI